MTAIWHNDGPRWRLAAPTGFPDEATLHDLVAKAPGILPLAGSPRLTVIGREVRLGVNYADLLAIEPSGRLTIVEIKLAHNAEARRAVIAQILAYAAFLHGLDPVALERDILDRHLHQLRHENLAAAVAAEDQEGSFDAENFTEGLGESLASGSFRLVLVLDDAPEELVRLVGYLGAIAEKILIDLVTVSAYEIGGSQIIVPQRIDPERQPVHHDRPASTGQRNAQGRLVPGAEDFEATIDQAPVDQRVALRQLADWAIAMEREGLVTLATYHGTANRWTLLPRLRDEGVGLVTIWNENGPYLQFWRSVFERRAPDSLARVEACGAGKVGQGTTTKDISDELLAALTEAYREATTGRPIQDASTNIPAKNDLLTEP